MKPTQRIAAALITLRLHGGRRNLKRVEIILRQFEYGGPDMGDMGLVVLAEMWAQDAPRARNDHDGTGWS
jgi:hypothetical protein